ncbi:unnamed protein product [Prorocentrum cordatum]|uniref:non-specific serine/threonine protein kinase n=1 Tax=Prorocentrum cordatum TaxID=2364126 RepID=A0ABN9R2Y0_9DINO|nr:unnamed protein product [Polarella glacialis]
MPYQLYSGRYRVLSKLGAGAFSTVWLCADERDQREDGPDLVAMKVCKSKKSVTEQAEDEVLLLERLESGGASPSHVTQMRGHFWHSGPNGRLASLAPSWGAFATADKAKHLGLHVGPDRADESWRAAVVKCLETATIWSRLGLGWLPSIEELRDLASAAVAARARVALREDVQAGGLQVGPHFPVRQAPDMARLRLRATSGGAGGEAWQAKWFARAAIRRHPQAYVGALVPLLAEGVAPRWRREVECRG